MSMVLKRSMSIPRKSYLLPELYPVEECFVAISCHRFRMDEKSMPSIPSPGHLSELIDNLRASEPPGKFHLIKGGVVMKHSNIWL